jgi:2-phospho-L-lactate guanylyltransferase
MWAIVPLKALESAKRRLANVLSPEERRALMLTMARDVLTALVRCRRLTGVLIVSRTPEADALAQAFGTERFMESPDADLSAALTQAAEYLREHRSARGIMIVPADVPLIDPEEIDEIVGRHETVTLMPDDEHVGTNGLICSPPGRIRLQFDGRSFKRHADAAYASGASPRVVPSRRFALDIDTPDDLRALPALGPGTQTATFLQKSGIADRLGAKPRCDRLGAKPRCDRLGAKPRCDRAGAQPRLQVDQRGREPGPGATVDEAAADAHNERLDSKP